jgi:hypothetical protein
VYIFYSYIKNRIASIQNIRLYRKEKWERITRRRITRKGMARTNGGVSREEGSQGQTETMVTDRDKVQERISTMHRMRRNGKELNVNPAGTLHSILAFFIWICNVMISVNLSFYLFLST